MTGHLGNGIIQHNKKRETIMKTIVFDKSTGNLQRGTTVLENKKAIVFRADCGRQQIITKKENIKILKVA